MKTSIISILFLALIAFACNNQPDVDFEGDGQVEATVAGNLFSAKLSVAFFMDSTLQLGRLDKDNAQLQFNQIYTTGTYDLGLQNGGYIDNIMLMLEDGTHLSMGDGTYTISKLTNRNTEGTFSGTAYALTDIFFQNPIKVEAGTFEANF
ncbi:MAG: hypothetical protein AAFR61_18955 [Bacteroidota bacterium]